MVSKAEDKTSSQYSNKWMSPCTLGWLIDWWSEGCGIVATPELSICAPVIADNADHFIHLWSDLHTACEAYKWSISFTSVHKSRLLSAWLLVELFKPWVWDVNCTLGAVNTSTEWVIGHLMRSHLVFSVTTLAVRMNTGHLVPVEHLEERLSSACRHTSRNTIGRHTVDPDDMVCHFDSTTLDCRSECMSAKHSWHLR